MPSLLRQVMTVPWLSRLRRNHALEHATVRLISARYPRTFVVGHSDPLGFTLHADLPTQVVQQAAQEALARLTKGEWHLAIHPNCGTNFIASGTLAGLAAFLSLSGTRGARRRDLLARLPFTILATTLAAVLAQPIGLQLQQRVTTQADPAGMVIRSVQRLPHGRAHRILTSG